MVKKKFEMFDVVLVILHSVLILFFFLLIEILTLLVMETTSLDTSNETITSWRFLFPGLITIYTVIKMIYRNMNERVISVLIGFITSILVWYY